MAEIIHTWIDVDGIQVRIDTVSTHGMSGYGFRIGDRAYTGGGYANPGAAKRAGRAAVRRALKAQDRGREAVDRMLREMRTIGRGPA
jgi:hypothetical protein